MGGEIPRPQGSRKSGKEKVSLWLSWFDKLTMRSFGNCTGSSS
jgi:hypothetical protein